MRKRVAVTGIGVVSPLGNSIENFRDNLLEGISAGAPVTLFDPAELPTKIAAQVATEDLSLEKIFFQKSALQKPALQIKDRKIAFGILAARSAIADANSSGRLIADHYKESSGSLSIGIGLELFSMPDMIRFIDESEIPLENHPLEFLQTPSDVCLHMICKEHNLSIAPLTHISACSASTDAIGTAFKLIRDGKRSWMLAGGTDSMINPMGLGGFCRIEATTRRNSDPKRASRPFDRDRDGFLLGEGAGMFLLEPFNQAEERGAKIYGEILGYGNSFDAYGISEPHPEGEGAYLSMSRALDSAGIRPEDVTYINAHGTSTPKNDPVETKAIKRLFGSHAKEIPVSSTKSMIGHLISAAGAVEMAATFLCGKSGWVHPTINLENQDASCDLDYIKGVARRMKVDIFLKNSFAFGGQNTSLVGRIL